MQCLELPLLSVPAAVWQCPSCVAAGVEVKAAEQVVWKSGMDPLAAPLPTHEHRGRSLIPLSGKDRQSDAEARALHGRIVKHNFDGKDWHGQVVFLGAQERPYHFRVDYTDGDYEQ